MSHVPEETGPIAEARKGGRSGEKLRFSSRQLYSDALGRVGLRVSSSVTMPGLFLDNVLLLAVRPGDPAGDAST